MTIDHASREPDPDTPVGLPKLARPEGFPAFDGLLTPRAGRPAYDLRPLTWAAVVLSNGQRTGTFTAVAFAEIVRIKFDLREPPDAAWCRKVLNGLPYVIAYPNDTYRVQTG